MGKTILSNDFRSREGRLEGKVWSHTVRLIRKCRSLRSVPIGWKMWAAIILKVVICCWRQWLSCSIVYQIEFSDNKRPPFLTLSSLPRCFLSVCKCPTSPESDAHCLGPYNIMNDQCYLFNGSYYGRSMFNGQWFILWVTNIPRSLVNG